MITPRFKVDQTDADLIFTIHAPYASIADAEICADLDIFCFYASPYYLRIHLSGHIEETDASKGSYDADSGTFVLSVQKVTKGEFFENLDFITALLTPSQSQKRDIAKPVVEVIDCNNENDENNGEDSDEDGSEWYIDQCPYDEPSEDFLLSAPHYGFANKLSGAFQNFKTEFLEVVDLPDPDSTPISERSKLRLAQEAEDFSDDHYLADWAQPEYIEPLLTFECWWEKSSQVEYLDEEVDILKDLPKKEFLLDKREEFLVSFSLIDILFGYAYNIRSTMGENTVESAWTVNKLSGTLSWFENLTTLREAAVVPVRRSLCYPLFRHWELAMKVLGDVNCILKLGKKHILKCLLEIYVMFNNSEPRYLLNQLYIRDYIIWIQKAFESQIKSLSAALDKIVLCKADVSLDLNELEMAADLVQKEEEEAAAAAKQISQVTLCEDIATLSLSEKRDCERNSSDSSDSEDDSTSSEDSSSSSSGLDSDDLSDKEEENK